MPGVSINDYVQYTSAYGDFPRFYNTALAPQDVMTLGTALATMINPTYVVIGGAIFIAYLGYKYYKELSHNIRDDGSIVINSELRDAFKNILTSDAGVSETIITTGMQNIPTSFTTTSVGTAYYRELDVLGYYESFKATSNSFILPADCYLNVTFTSDICNEIAQETGRNVFYSNRTNRYAPEKAHLKPQIYFNVTSSSFEKYTSAIAGFYHWYDTSAYGQGYIPMADGSVNYGAFDATNYSKSGVVSATVDIIKYAGQAVTDSILEINDDIVHEVNMPSTDEILDIPMNPVTNTVIPDGSVIKPTTGITDQIIDIPIKDIVDIEVPEVDVQPEPEPEPAPVIDWTTFFDWIANFFTNLGSLFQPLFDYIENFFDFLGDLLTFIFSPLFDFISDFFIKLGDLLGDILGMIFEPLFDFISDFFVKLKELISELFVPTIDLSSAFDIPDDKFIPFHKFSFDDLFNITPKPIRFDTVVNFGSITYPIKLYLDEVDIIMDNIDLIRNIFSYTLLLISINLAISVLLPKRVMD